MEKLCGSDNHASLCAADAVRGSKPVNLLQPIDNPQTNLGLRLEGKVGYGKLLICGMNLKSLAVSSPAARQLLDSIYSYMESPS